MPQLHLSHTTCHLFRDLLLPYTSFLKLRTRFELYSNVHAHSSLLATPMTDDSPPTWSYFPADYQPFCAYTDGSSYTDDGQSPSSDSREPLRRSALNKPLPPLPPSRDESASPTALSDSGRPPSIASTHDSTVRANVRARAVELFPKARGGTRSLKSKKISSSYMSILESLKTLPHRSPASPPPVSKTDAWTQTRLTYDPKAPDPTSADALLTTIQERTLALISQVREPPPTTQSASSRSTRRDYFGPNASRFMDSAAERRSSTSRASNDSRQHSRSKLSTVTESHVRAQASGDSVATYESRYDEAWNSTAPTSATWEPQVSGPYSPASEPAVRRSNPGLKRPRALHHTASLSEGRVQTSKETLEAISMPRPSPRLNGRFLRRSTPSEFSLRRQAKIVQTPMPKLLVPQNPGLQDSDAREPGPLPTPPSFRVPISGYFADEGPFLDIPDHLPTSPLCPRHPKHKSGGKGVCPMHGQAETPQNSTDSLAHYETGQRSPQGLAEFLALNGQRRGEMVAATMRMPGTPRTPGPERQY